MTENMYALIHPTNSLRITDMLLTKFNINTDIRFRATAHAPSTLTFSDPYNEKYDVKLLPSKCDGQQHRTTFSVINTHTPLFRKLIKEGKIPWKRLSQFHSDFRETMQNVVAKKEFKFLKASVMLMTDVNPGKPEMRDKSFVSGLKLPFMEGVVATKTWWEGIDYEVF